MTWTVGFDLDMTLIDSRPGVSRAIDLVAAEFGLPLRGADLAEHLGPPLGMLLARFGTPEDLVPPVITRYRELYPSIVADIPAMPGAADALAAVSARGGRVLVVTGKHEPHARLHLDELGFQVDHLAGDLWSTDKAAALRAHGADIYVGDHVGDIHGALAAGALAVGIPTGPCTATDLRTAGAHTILPTLTAFPTWLTEYAAA